MAEAAASYVISPINANEAEARRITRFLNIGHIPDPMSVRADGRNPAFPFMLDLRRAPDYDGVQSIPKRESRKVNSKAAFMCADSERPKAA
jgi:Putative amidoligase enzyme (DUF2126)